MRVQLDDQQTVSLLISVETGCLYIKLTNMGTLVHKPRLTSRPNVKRMIGISCYLKTELLCFIQPYQANLNIIPISLAGSRSIVIDLRQHRIQLELTILYNSWFCCYSH